MTDIFLCITIYLGVKKNKANKEVNNMKRYKNRKSDVVVKVINQSEEENKINVEFVNGKKAGQKVSYKLASFTKSWKFLDEVQSIEEVKEYTKDEVKKPSTKKVNVSEKIEIMSSAIKSRGYSIKIYSGRIQNLNIKKENKHIAEVCLKHKKIVVYTKEQLTGESEKINNGKFKTLFFYSDNFANEIMEIIERGM